MKSHSTFLRSIAAVSALLVLAVCPSCQSRPVESVKSTDTLKSAVEAQPVQTKLRIATFNIQNLGPTKLAKPQIISELVSLVRKYDVVAVQEIDDRTLRTPAAFLARINDVAGPRYAMVVSPLTGTTATAGQDEQYAFFFNAEKVEALDGGILYPDPQDKFIREPFAVQLKARDSRESLVLLTVHTEATKAGAAREIAALAPAAVWAQQHYTGELGVIVLGDFNAGVTYLTVQQVAAIRAAHLPFRWIVPDDADTTNSSQDDQAHDRLVVIGSALDGRFTGTWGVDRTVSSKDVSDHLPVWADFWFAGKN